MPRFTMNKNQQDNGDYEVHNSTTGCSYMPNEENQIDLGSHSNCRGAVSLAKISWPDKRINGCYYCCNECHTT
jgi:hypothetical protein